MQDRQRLQVPHHHLPLHLIESVADKRVRLPQNTIAGSRSRKGWNAKKPVKNERDDCEPTVELTQLELLALRLWTLPDLPRHGRTDGFPGLLSKMVVKS